MSETTFSMRTDLPPLPPRMRGLPIDARGFPVPWFVEWVDGVPAFQIADSRKFAKAIKFKRCWLCGQTMGAVSAFVIGPMSGVNRVSAEPPSHRECAEYAVHDACPFLTRPMARRTDRGIEHIATREPAGVMIKRNPGVTLLWLTKGYRPFRAGNGVLLNIGEPVECHFFREGRAATRAEIEESVDTGLPFLEQPAREQGAAAVAELSRMLSAFRSLLPAAQEQI